MDTFFFIRTFSNFHVFLNDLFHGFLARNSQFFIFSIWITSDKISIVRNNTWMFFSEHGSDHRLAPDVLLLWFFISLSVTESICVCLHSKGKQKVVLAMGTQTIFHQFHRIFGKLNCWFQWRWVAISVLAQEAFWLLLSQVRVKNGVICAKKLKVAILDKIEQFHSFFRFEFIGKHIS